MEKIIFYVSFIMRVSFIRKFGSKDALERINNRERSVMGNVQKYNVTQRSRKLIRCEQGGRVKRGLIDGQRERGHRVNKPWP